MPMGIVWLVVGTVIGLVAGWLLVGQSLVGGAAGFVITLVLLLVGNWLGGRGRDKDDIRISG
jgi:uncharacterized membrane protein YeaQ/YmgE (transglycosylase-associated protein family)